MSECPALGLVWVLCVAFFMFGFIAGFLLGGDVKSIENA